MAPKTIEEQIVGCAAFGRVSESEVHAEMARRHNQQHKPSAN